MNDLFIFVSAFVSIVVLVTLGYANRVLESVAARLETIARAQEAAAKALSSIEETPRILKQIAGVLAAQNFQLESLDRRLGGEGSSAVKIEKQPRS